jgi:uncharacterized protein
MKIKILLIIIPLVVFTFLFVSCSKGYSPEDEKYITEINKLRQQKDDFMKNDPSSPFNSRTKVEFSNLKYYKPDPEFVFKSKLYEFEKKDTIIIYGTKGEKRNAVKFGYVKFNHDGKDYLINVYEGITRNGETYYSIWFTDKTTGKETYGVGRYIDFDLNPDKNFVYAIDFNLAYNPYCAYSPDYSCAIPSKEDHIDLAVEAGEKSFH